MDFHMGVTDVAETPIAQGTRHALSRVVRQPHVRGAIPEDLVTTAPGVNPRSRGALRPGFCKPITLDERVQGMPGARCTRGLVCNLR
jgi:hypothetical protein